MRLYTIGFTQKSAERFFALLSEHRVGRLIDIRLNPDGQLSGFAKRADLPYFLDRLAGCGYLHLPELAPTPEILSTYRASKDWGAYETQFQALMTERRISASLDRSLFSGPPPCLLCSEPTADRCHRRLVAERLAEAWSGLEVVHLV